MPSNTKYMHKHKVFPFPNIISLYTEDRSTAIEAYFIVLVTAGQVQIDDIYERMLEAKENNCT